MRRRIRKRSSCASGRGKVPSSSTGFCVAITTKGQGSGRVSLDGNLSFFHCFQQRGLGARRGAVDLVGQYDLSQQGAGTKLKLAFLLVIKRNARNIRRKQIGCELNALERTAKRFCQ